MVSRIPRLNTEGASGPALTFEAVTHRDSDRLALAHEPELPAATRRLSNFHAHAFLPLFLGSNGLHERHMARGPPARRLAARAARLLTAICAGLLEIVLRRVGWSLRPTRGTCAALKAPAMAQRHNQKPSVLYRRRNGNRNAPLREADPSQASSIHRNGPAAGAPPTSQKREVRYRRSSQSWRLKRGTDFGIIAPRRNNSAHLHWSWRANLRCGAPWRPPGAVRALQLPAGSN